MQESYIEAWLRRQIEELGGKFYKWTSPGNDGVPDRIAILPGGKIYLVELKTKKGKLSEIQKWQQGIMKDLGCNVRTIYGMDDAHCLIEMMRAKL